MVVTEGRVIEGLVIDAQHGDRHAFAELMRLEGDRLYALAYRILRDPHLAQDAFQEAAISAWRRLPSLREPARFEAWIHRIVVHACYAESRRRTRWTATIHAVKTEETSTAEATLAVDDRDALELAFRQLSVDQRAVFVLHHHIGLPLVEIAETLGIPAGTARSRLHYATETLRTALGDE